MQNKTINEYDLILEKLITESNLFKSFQEIKIEITNNYATGILKYSDYSRKYFKILIEWYLQNDLRFDFKIIYYEMIEYQYSNFRQCLNLDHDIMYANKYFNNCSEQINNKVYNEMIIFKNRFEPIFKLIEENSEENLQRGEAFINSDNENIEVCLQMSKQKTSIELIQEIKLLQEQLQQVEQVELDRNNIEIFLKKEDYISVLGSFNVERGCKMIEALNKGKKLIIILKDIKYLIQKNFTTLSILTLNNKYVVIDHNNHLNAFNEIFSSNNDFNVYFYIGKDFKT